MPQSCLRRALWRELRAAKPGLLGAPGGREPSKPEGQAREEGPRGPVPAALPREAVLRPGPSAGGPCALASASLMLMKCRCERVVAGTTGSAELQRAGGCPKPRAPGPACRPVAGLPGPQPQPRGQGSGCPPNTCLSPARAYGLPDPCSLGVPRKPSRERAEMGRRVPLLLWVLHLRHTQMAAICAHNSAEGGDTRGPRAPARPHAGLSLGWRVR